MWSAYRTGIRAAFLGGTGRLHLRDKRYPVVGPAGRLVGAYVHHGGLASKRCGLSFCVNNAVIAQELMVAIGVGGVLDVDSLVVVL